MSLSLLLRLSLSAVLTAGALSAGAAQTAIGAASIGGYAAPGDSYAAGPGIPQTSADSGLCVRSDHNHPSLVARGISAATFTDFTCGGAITDPMTGRQFGIARNSTR